MPRRRLTDSGDTLAEHRLARARADRVRDEMIDRGLAASAIASVWDWQFVVKEPRVTLWVFDLPEGPRLQGHAARASRPRRRGRTHDERGAVGRGGRPTR